jgi:transposase-like protein
VIDGLLPGAWRTTEQYANNRVESDHGRFKTRLRPMRGLKKNRTASVLTRGHAFVQILRRGHYKLGTDAKPALDLGRSGLAQRRPSVSARRWLRL